MPDTELAEELLQIEEADAWFEYLEATRGSEEYEATEQEAWRHLQERLADIDAELLLAHSSGA